MIFIGYNVDANAAASFYTRRLKVIYNHNIAVKVFMKFLDPFAILQNMIR